MRSRSPQLVVPVRDRRKSRRIITLKNFGLSLLALLVVLTAANFRAEMRGRNGEDFGRLIKREMPPETEIKPAPPVVAEVAPVEDHTTPDPMLMAGVAREQYLGVNSVDIAAVVPETVPAKPILLQKGHGKIAIVGDGTGVGVVTESVASQPKLRGGFFRE